MKMPTVPTILHLFAGIGGFYFALTRLGFEATLGIICLIIFFNRR